MRPIAVMQTVYCLMTITKNPHMRTEIYQNQENHQKTKNAHGDVRQDKRAKYSARTASLQPARSPIPLRAQPLTTKTARSQKTTVTKRRTVQLTLWISPIEKAEVERRAQRESSATGKTISLSSVGAALFRRGMQTDLDIEYGALLTPVFESILKRYMTARDNRLASLLVRACISIEQTRGVAVNILGRQPAKAQNVLKPDVLNDILDRSLDDAKKKITNRSPELKELIKELNHWIVDQEK
jgi:hypothetical protein